MEAWQNQYIASYVHLQKGVTPKDLESPCSTFVNENAQPQVAAGMKPHLVPFKRNYLRQ